MKFLKGIIARPPQALAVTPDPPPEAAPQTDPVPEDLEPVATQDRPAEAVADEDDKGVGTANPANPETDDEGVLQSETAVEPESAAPDDTAEDEVRIWDLFGDDDAGAVSAVRAAAPRRAEGSAPSDNDLAREAMRLIAVRARPEGQQAGNAPPSAGRAKTRLLGFSAADAIGGDVFDQARIGPATADPRPFPVGWLVVVEGPGRGAAFTLHAGVSSIGRGDDQAVQLDFGDMAISRENHAAIAYDDEQGKFFIGHGGKANIVRLNGRPILSTEEMANADLIRIGETTLRLVALCGPEFAWNAPEDDAARAHG